jgi:radical SAM superfamily enzyme YgiQ (UPF0313 family)
MKVLLINPNRFRNPPVPPIGLEYIAGHLMNKGHPVEALDLCFVKDIYKELDNACSSFKPDIAGITIRNIDSALYQHNEFFLNEIRQIVDHLKTGHGLRIMIGGSGVSIDPEGILDYLDADFAFVGHAEHSINHELEGAAAYGKGKKIIHCSNMVPDHCFRSFEKTDYNMYFKQNGIAGFETHRGCSSDCVYCVEAGSRVQFKEIGSVISEIQDMVSRGYDAFHLCDPEFNEDPDHAEAFCESLKKIKPPINWTAYMKPGGCSEDLFSLMRETGVYLITLTVDSFHRDGRYWFDVEQSIGRARSAGIKVAVDFLTGFPYEEDDTLHRCLDRFRMYGPDSVNINTYIRLYKPLRVTEIIRNDPKLRKNLLGDVNDSSFLRPVFYNQIAQERLKELIRNEPMFLMDGLDKKVNYCRLPRRKNGPVPEP